MSDINLFVRGRWLTSYPAHHNLTSNRTHFLRITETSFDCSGATSCLTVKAIFLRLFHFSGSSCILHHVI